MARRRRARPRSRSRTPTAASARSPSTCASPRAASCCCACASAPTRWSRTSASGWLAAQGLGAGAIQARNPRCVVAGTLGLRRDGAARRAGLLRHRRAGDRRPAGDHRLRGRTAGARRRRARRTSSAASTSPSASPRRCSSASARAGARALDLSNQDAIFAITDSAATIFAGIGARMERVGNQHPFTAPYDAFATRDGHVVIATASNKLFRKLCAAIGRPELASDERYRSHRGRARNRDRDQRARRGLGAASAPAPRCSPRSARRARTFPARRCSARTS